jgi:hypothetical protein
MKHLPLLDYNLPPLVNGGPHCRGITALQGGGHGDVAFQIHFHFYLSSSQERKAKGSTLYACPLAHVPFAKCKKAKFELLDGYGMIHHCLEECKECFVSSCAITVYSKSGTSKLCTYSLPKEIDMETLPIEASPDDVNRRLLWKVGNEEQVR